MYVRELQREKWRTQSQALMLALREQKRRTTQEKASLKMNTHINSQGIFYAVLIFELLYVCTKSKRATWTGHITQSEQVYSALESEVVMFRLFVLCTFRFRKKYSKMSKKWTVQLKPVQKNYSYIPDLMERIFLKGHWDISRSMYACQQITSYEFPVQSQKFQPHHLRNLLQREWKGCKSQYDALFFCFVLM